MLLPKKAEFRVFGAICGGLSASSGLMLALERRAKQRPFSRFRYFSSYHLTFCVSGVDYMAFLKNYPIPQEVKGMADGDSLRQLFSSSGLTFARVRGIVRYLFGAPRVVRGATGGLSRDRR